MSLRQSDEDVCPNPRETANRETLSLEVGRLQIALVATRRGYSDQPDWPGRIALSPNPPEGNQTPETASRVMLN